MTHNLPPQTSVPESSAVETARAKRILIVDDEPAIRSLLSKMFADEGYAVSQAADGAEALDCLRSSVPDIVILDLMMPVMNGIQFLGQCRNIDGCAELPIVLLSATYEMVRKATRSPGLDVQAYLGKPFDVHELLTQVDLLLASSSAQADIADVAAHHAHDPLRVLLALDRPLVVQIARLTLSHGAYETRIVTTGDQAEATLATWPPDLVLLDMDLEDATLMLQHANARQAGAARLPVIGLTARGDMKSKLAAFDAGVDDILTVPFAPDELLARVIAVAGRSYRNIARVTRVIDVAHIEFDILNRTAHTGRSDLHLTSVEQTLLYLLAANAGRVVSQKEISDLLWGADSAVERSMVDQQVRNLRARLLNASDREQFIVTVPGRGYRFRRGEPHSLDWHEQVAN